MLIEELIYQQPFRACFEVLQSRPKNSADLIISCSLFCDVEMVKFLLSFEGLSQWTAKQFSLVLKFFSVSSIPLFYISI